MRRAVVFAMLGAMCLAPAVPATVIDWEDGTWDHGSGNQTGYSSGSASGTTNDGNVTVDWAEFGTATGNHTGLGGAQPRVRTDFNGSSLDGALSIGTAGDNNAGTRQNYVTLTVAFSTSVEILEFLLGDVDRGGAASWEDFIGVEGRIGGESGTLVTTVYAINPASPNRHTLVTMFGLDGVRGSNGDVTFDSDAANVGVSFVGRVDFIRLFFHQGTGTTGTSQHGVWLRDISYDVPEPATWALAGAGFALLLAFKRQAPVREGVRVARRIDY